VSPIIESVSVLHNFTIESQVQFHAPLAFTPQSTSEGVYALTPEDLTVFMNSAEWTLCDYHFPMLIYYLLILVL
jgi:phosphatidylinositol glycan class S